MVKRHVRWKTKSGRLAWEGPVGAKRRGSRQRFGVKAVLPKYLMVGVAAELHVEHSTVDLGAARADFMEMGLCTARVGFVW